MQGKITKRAVDGLDDGILWDPELRGFGVRARPAGKTYLLKFRANGRQRWHTIGRHGAPWTPEQARREAKRLLGELTTGKSPERGSTTIAEAVEGFVEAYCQHKRSGDQTAYLLRRNVVSRWGNRRIADITHRDIVELLADVQGPDRSRRAYIANRVRSALSRLFRWAISEAMIPSRENPVAGTEPRRGEIQRERVLSDHEVTAVWDAAASDFPHGHIVRLLLGTGQRRNEVGGMRWSELDLAGRTWRLPASRTKGNRDHLVPLNDLALSILETCPRIERHDCIFATRTENSFSGWSAAKHRLDDRCGVQDWRLHDLRRTVATGMQAAGVLPHTVAAVLNHSTAGLFGVTAIYLRDRQEEAKREAMDVWGRQLASALSAGH